MKVYTDLDRISIETPVITIGVFDGLHKGHQKLLGLVCEKAKEIGGQSVVLTFWPHPRMVLAKEGTDFQLLSTLEEKEHLFGQWGIDNLIVIPFTRDFSRMDGERFISEILVGKIGMKYLFIGDDHRFGNDRRGGKELLTEMADSFGFGFTTMESKIENQERVSSSLVRNAIKKGDLATANLLLGFPYFMFGKVIEGNQLGRKIGFPTANIACCVENKLVPEEGVYVVEVEFADKKCGGMLNIGTRPTVDSTRKKSIEVHIFDFSNDLYGERLKVSFLHRLRDEMKFRDMEELKAQLQMDEARARAWLSKKV